MIGDQKEDSEIDVVVSPLMTSTTDNPLKNRPGELDLDAEVSNTIYFRGVSPKALEDVDVIRLLSIIESPREIDMNERQLRGSGSVWACYNSVEAARKTIMKLHDIQFRGYFRNLGLMTSFELGPDETGYRMRASICYNPVLRRICDMQKKPLQKYDDWLASKDPKKSPKGTKPGKDAEKSGSKSMECEGKNPLDQAENPLNEADNSVQNPHKMTEKKLQKKAERKLAREQYRSLAAAENSSTVFPDNAFTVGNPVASDTSVVVSDAVVSSGAVTTAKDAVASDKALTSESVVPLDKTIGVEPSTTLATAKPNTETMTTPKDNIKTPKDKSAKIKTPRTGNIFTPEVFKWGFHTMDGETLEAEETIAKDRDLRKKEQKQKLKQTKKLVKTPNVILHEVHDIQYQQKGVVVNRETLYPVPTGAYLSRILQKTRVCPPSRDPLMWLVSDVEAHGGKKNYDKEISESMSMVDAVERAIRLLVGSALKPIKNVNVFVVGDGKLPLTSAALACFLPVDIHENKWNFYSIDPLMDEAYFETAKKEQDSFLTAEERRMRDERVALYKDRFFTHNLFSQQFLMDQVLKETGREDWQRFEFVDEGGTICEELPQEVLPQEVDSKSATDNTKLNFGTMLKNGPKVEVSMGNRVFSVPAPPATNGLSIIVACHSHAPLKEFWERVPSPKVCVTLACCENFADLGRKPDFQYDDFDIYSPKRRIKAYIA